MSKFVESSPRGFFFWSLAPFLVTTLLVMPLANPPTRTGVVVLWGVELLVALVFLGLFNPIRFWWAWRGVGATMFVGYVAYVIAMYLEHGFDLGRLGEPSTRTALAGLFAFGLPGLWFALFGRLTPYKEHAQLTGELSVTPSSSRHPDNAPGDFYVEDMCISCLAPHGQAPDLLGFPDSSPKSEGCYFRRQPTTSDEIGQACNAVSVSCIEAVRYAGKDREILLQLYNLSAYSSCDVEPSDVEQRVAEYVRNNFSEAVAGGVRWTFVRDELPDGWIIACCYGGTHRYMLGVFAVDRLSKSIRLLEDDTKYRPTLDHFRGPND